MNKKYVLIATIMILFGVIFTAYAEYSPVKKIEITDRLYITDKAVITKQPTTAP